MAGVLSLLAVLVISFLAGVIPTAVYAAIVWWLARYKKAPFWLLGLAFVWGAIPAVILSLIAELLLNMPVQALLAPFAADVFGASAIAPVVEESTKALSLLFLVLFFRRYFDDVLDGISFGAFAGLGFAATEDFFYFLGAFVEGGAVSWSMTVLMRKIIFGLNHAFFTSIAGASFGQARLSKDWTGRLLLPVAGLAVAISFHAFHNLSSSFASVVCWSLLLGLVSDWLGILATVVLIVFVLSRERKWIIEELGEEVNQGALFPDEYYVAASAWKRLKARWQIWREQGWVAYRRLGRFYQWLTELAFKKHLLRTLGADQGISLEIGRLRARIGQIRREIGLPIPAGETGAAAAGLAGPSAPAVATASILGPAGLGGDIGGERFLVGRTQGDLVVPHPQISRRHAEIWRVATAYRLADLNSTNGTRVNGKLVKEAWLNDGDLVSFGPVDFTFRRPAAPVEAEEPLSPAARPATPERVAASLTFTQGSERGRQVWLDRQVTIIGREKGDLLLDDPFVSRQHAEIWRTGNSYYIADLKSKNGTLVNGEPVNTPKLLHHGDTLSLGETTFSFRLEAA